MQRRPLHTGAPGRAREELLMGLETPSPEGGFSADAGPLHRPTRLSHMWESQNMGGIHIHVGWKHPTAGERSSLLIC